MSKKQGRKYSTCKKTKPFTDFYLYYSKPRKKMLYASSCKACQRIINRKRNRLPERRKYNHQWRQEHNYDKTGFARIRRNVKARVVAAVKSGKLEKCPCWVCGSKKVEGHHPDYTKPLEVIWLCGEHHRKEHRRLRKEGWG